MPQISLHFVGDGEGAFPDLADRRSDVIHVTESPLQIAALRGGMTSGQNSIMLRIDLPDGRVLMAESSVRAFLSAAVALRAWDGGKSGVVFPPVRGGG